MIVKPTLTQRERVEESARRLLDAAIELIAEQGFERTTVAQIGERAGYSNSGPCSIRVEERSAGVAVHG